MKITDAFSICFKLFHKEFISYFFILLVSLFVIGFIVVVTYKYQHEMDKKFASKQPQITLSFQEKKDIKKILNSLKKNSEIKAISPYIKASSWGQFKASTGVFSNKQNRTFDKFYSGLFTVIGINKLSPAVIDMQNLNYYSSGPYKIRVTNLEFEYAWITTPKMIIPNAVFDGGFFPPISQEALISDLKSKQTWLLKGFIQDYSDEAIIYVGIDEFNLQIIDRKEPYEQGFFIRVKEGVVLKDILTKIDQECKEHEVSCLTNTWLESKGKQKKVLKLINVFSVVFIIIVSMLSFFLNGLFQMKLLISKYKTINILHITGYRFTPYMIFTMFLLTLFVCGLFFFSLFCVVEFNFIGNALGSNLFSYLTFLGLTLCVISFISVTVIFKNTMLEFAYD